MLDFQVMLERSLTAAPSLCFSSRGFIEDEMAAAFSLCWQYYCRFYSVIPLWSPPVPLSHNQTHPDCCKLTSPVTFWQCLSTHFHVPCTMKLSQASATWVVDLFLIFHLHRKHSGEVDPRGQALLSQRSHHLSRKQERPAQRWAHTSGAGQNEAGTRNHLLRNAQLRPEVVDLPPLWLSQ